MKVARRIGLAVVLTALFSGPALAQAVPDSLPPGVTAEMITTGASLFNGMGLCMACHGPDAKGMGGLAADLTDEEWTHAKDGAYEAIVDQILKGLTADQSSNGVAMPERGGSSLTDEQVRAVAAYVWTLSRV